MVNPLALLRLDLELRQWRRLGSRPMLWWRDDDARTVTAALEQLLATAGERPIALAVIPDGDLLELAQRLATLPNVSVGQHGVDHLNRSLVGVAPSEHPADVTPIGMTQALEAARKRMEAAGLAPCFFTPPWNACQPDLAQALASIGFDCLSAGKDTPSYPGLYALPAAIDILRWKNGPRFRGSAKVLSALTGCLRAHRLRSDTVTPIGLLTHHIVHDTASWRFLTWFLAYTDRRFHWVSIGAHR